MQFWTYLLRCADGSYYVGHTDDFDLRLAKHHDGTYGGYTSTRRPIVLVYAEAFDSRDDAFHRERQIKGWSRAKKEALAREDWQELKRLARTAHPSTSSGERARRIPLVGRARSPIDLSTRARGRGRRSARFSARPSTGRAGRRRRRGTTPARSRCSQSSRGGCA